MIFTIFQIIQCTLERRARPTSMSSQYRLTTERDDELTGETVKVRWGNSAAMRRDWMYEWVVL